MARKRKRSLVLVGTCNVCRAVVDTVDRRAGVHPTGVSTRSFTDAWFLAGAALADELALNLRCAGIGKLTRKFVLERQAATRTRIENDTAWQREAAVGALDMHLANRAAAGSMWPVAVVAMPNRALFWRAAFRWYTHASPNIRGLRSPTASTVWSKERRPGYGVKVHVLRCLFCGHEVSHFPVGMWSPMPAEQRWSRVFDHTFECALRFLAGGLELGRREPAQTGHGQLNGDPS